MNDSKKIPIPTEESIEADRQQQYRDLGLPVPPRPVDAVPLAGIDLRSLLVPAYTKVTVRDEETGRTEIATVTPELREETLRSLDWIARHETGLYEFLADFEEKRLYIGCGCESMFQCMEILAEKLHLGIRTLHRARQIARGLGGKMQEAAKALSQDRLLELARLGPKSVAARFTVRDVNDPVAGEFRKPHGFLKVTDQQVVDITEKKMPVVRKIIDEVGRADGVKMHGREAPKPRDEGKTEPTVRMAWIVIFLARAKKPPQAGQIAAYLRQAEDLPAGTDLEGAVNKYLHRLEAHRIVAKIETIKGKKPEVRWQLIGTVREPMSSGLIAQAEED